MHKWLIYIPWGLGHLSLIRELCLHHFWGAEWKMTIDACSRSLTDRLLEQFGKNSGGESRAITHMEQIRWNKWKMGGQLGN